MRRERRPRRRRDILYGPVTPNRSLTEADAVLHGSTGLFSGEFLAVLDMDGDGVDELVIGAPGPVVGLGPLVEECYDQTFDFPPLHPRY